MAIWLCGYDTALNAFRYARTRMAELPRTLISLDEAVTSLGPCPRKDLISWLSRGDVAHLIVKTAADLRRNASVVTHAWGATSNEWPAIPLNDNVFVCAPEFVFLQMATILNYNSLVFLGYELCGLYGFSGERITLQDQLVSAEEIRSFLMNHPHARGRRLALEAIGRVLDGSASPMETELTMRLSYPRKMGGYGIAAPQLNHTIALSGAHAKAVGTDHITPDLYWPNAKLAIEYDSDFEHTGADRITRDAKRRIVYDSAGIRAITMTNTQMGSPMDFDRVAQEVGKATGKRLRPARPDERRKRQQLRNETHRLATDKTSLTWAGNRSARG